MNFPSLKAGTYQTIPLPRAARTVSTRYKKLERDGREAGRVRDVRKKERKDDSPTR